MACLKLLVDAIDVIVTAPYCVDIATLHTVIQSIDDNTVDQWCCVKRCQIPKLATYLNKPIFEQRGMAVFERFCRVTTFSRIVTERCPEILPQLLAGALKEGEKSCMNGLCCRLLGAHPLEAGLPADLPRFLEKLMRATHEFPNADLLHGLREIVAMQSANILDVVTEDVLEEFIKTCKLLTKDSTSNWHEAAIVSMNIGSAVYDDMFFDEPGWPQRKTPISERSDAFGDWGEKMMAYFQGYRAVRFLHSIVARVMFFTSRNQNIPMLTRCRILDTVFQTLERSRYGIREFSDENPGAVEKVWRNTAGEEIDFNTRFSAFAVAYKITPEGAYPDNIEGVLLQLMTVIVSEDGVCSICFDPNAQFKAKQLTDALCCLLQDDRKPCLLMLRRFVDFVLVQCLACEYPCTDSTDFLKKSAALVLLDALSESMKKKEHKHVFAILLDILDNPEVVEDRKLFIRSLTSSLEPVAKVHCRGNLVCGQELFELSNQLRHKLIILLLHGACTTSSNLSTKDFAFLQDRALAYNPKASLKKCQYPADIENSAFTPPPPLLPRVEGDWRQQIVDIMDGIQRQSTDAVLHQVNTVCYEFEARCKTVEQPLRQAESHAAQLQDELDRTRARLDQKVATNAVLMGTLKTDKVAMDEKDLEIHALTERLIELKDSAQQQNDKIAQLMADITSLKLEHDSNITALRTEAASAKEDLETLNKAEQFSWEEQLEAEKQNAEKLRATIAWLESEKRKLLEEQKADFKNYQESMQQMKSEHERAYNDVAEQTTRLETQLNGQSAEIMELKQAVSKHEEELRSKVERLHGFKESEMEWQQEKRELQEQLQLAEEKEKKVLAAIRGQEQDSCC